MSEQKFFPSQEGPPSDPLEQRIWMLERLVLFLVSQLPPGTEIPPDALGVILGLRVNHPDV